MARRRPQTLARQASSLAMLSNERFVLGLGLGDDGLGEFSAFGDETDPRVRGRMLDELKALEGSSSIADAAAGLAAAAAAAAALASRASTACQPRLPKASRRWRRVRP